MELIIVAGFVLGLAAALAYLARTYPIDSRDLVADSIVGGHSSPAPLWPVKG